MTDDLTQAEADELLEMPKTKISDEPYEFPSVGAKISVELASLDGREKFQLDVVRGYISFSKQTYQSRGRSSVVLARLDLGGAPHRNPDGVEIMCPHLHVYREGYADKWAIPVPAGQFRNLDRIEDVIEDFMAFCRIVDPPDFRFGLL